MPKVLMDGVEVDAPAGMAQAAAERAREATRAPAAVRLPAAAFLARLTPPERLALAAAAQRDPAVLLWALDLAARGEVDLAAPRTAADLDALVAAGVLTRARAAAVAMT